MPGPRVSKEDLEGAGFKSGAGPNWYYPSNGYPHIHLGAPGAKDKRSEVTFISISLEGRGQNLAEGQKNKFDDFKFDLGTPNIVWGTNERVFKQVLELIKVAI